MNNIRAKVLEAKKFLCDRIQNPYEVGLLTGTGLADAVSSMRVDFEFEYSKIPHFPVSTIESHRGKLLFGTIEGKHLVVMQGRVHLYEGYSPFEVTFPIRLMQELNVK
ncbi:MAG: purine-nucleoside phosphorylase, partial [Desulfobacteraceae bacterium]|nr:purine-nucleoside phosphorylase [Desulfobacteraceae bacterium]